MSVVTNLLLSFDILERESERIEEVQAFPWRHGVGLSDMTRGDHGGTKGFELPLWGGAFNYLDLTAFMEHLRTKVKWRHPDLVRVIVAEQDDDAFRIETLA